EASGQLPTPERTPVPEPASSRTPGAWYNTPSASGPPTGAPTAERSPSEPSEDEDDEDSDEDSDDESDEEPAEAEASIPTRGRGCRIHKGMKTGNIVQGPRTRKSAHMAAVMPANAYHAPFHAGASKPLHQNPLPAEPKGYQDLKGHLFEREFRQAMQVEIQT